jgi:hypothetical protein
MTSTLSRFGVPLGSGSGRGGILQPKVKYKFRVRVINFGPLQGGLELTQQVMSVGRPKVSQFTHTTRLLTMALSHSGKPLA